ncbi:thiamine pyrophosphate-dependent dehydrogenase E1 component subunit alpha [Akkermansiaceae bacterium]|nr:thiamine pyrophosphate-dependent dehydrogenase E1 component subunit alpha [Akkermansiaceae bacterium]MDA7931466.1 thiamine pyrophosphate-dependent dehydrogenase E1 component subunit alpha [Akkermansiaceae bacterium]MDB4259611.1 thiamine pyrophosphate-dependent dehydrogenase E1 component subunit alpha [Akkermansiaceae bacterium]MDB4294783.1 thiamine pyrophosphate-dependent dehydrogenase E1 component subunit alpha [Akkermansiaceae bacterium]MDB4386787.1 thiamine pyrophosphate-dependent dehydro
MSSFSFSPPPAPSRQAGLDGDLLRRVFRAMITARTLEAKLSSLYKGGKIVGGVYLGTGQEAVSASLGACLTRGKDYFAPLIRDQAGRTAFGETLLDATRTYLGSVEGPMRGRDGNVHRGRPLEGMPAMISHLGTAVSMVSGMLVAQRMKGELDGMVGATSIGDGATSTGSFHEGLNMAAVENLPLVVVVADNQFAYSTPRDRQFACESLLERASGYGVGGTEVDGTDLNETLSGIQQAVTSAREGYGPQLVIARLLRLCGHGEHDDASYVPQELRDSVMGRDCLDVATTQLIEAGHVTEEEITAWKKQATEEVQEAVATAQRENSPDPYQEDWSATSVEGMS